MRHMFVSSVALLFLSLPMSAPAMAQDSDEQEIPPPASSGQPQLRVELIGLTGVGQFLAPTVGYQRVIFILGAEVRVAHASGHGVLVRVAHGATLWGGGTAADLAYLFRLNLVGTGRNGGGIDFAIGPSFVWLAHDQGDVPRGATLGGQAGIALTGREEIFSASLGAQFHGFVPLEGASNGGPTGLEMAITVMGGLGFGFYG